MDTGPKDGNDIWHNKNSDDFLRYIKWESFNFGFYLTHFLMTIVVFIYFRIYYCDYTYAGAKYNLNLLVIPILLCSMRILSMRVFAQ